MDVTTEVFNLFAPHITQSEAFNNQHNTKRKRQGLLPDFLIQKRDRRPRLMDVKMMGCGKAYNPPERNNMSRRHAVEKRAKQVNSDCKTKARDVDRQFNNTSAGTLGPMERALKSFGTVEGLVFGAFAECNNAALKLMDEIATASALHNWKVMGCQDAGEAKSALARKVRRELGIAAARAQARLKLDRVGQLVMSGMGAAMERRSVARARFQELRTAHYLDNNPGARWCELQGALAI